MANVLLRLRDATTPIRIRWRIRLAAGRRELGYTLDIAVTALLLIAVLQVNSNEDLEESSKIALEVLIATLEIVFVGLRIIMRRLRKLATDTLTVIPRDRLSKTLYLHLDSQRGALMDRTSHLVEQSDCELEKHEMYAELIGLTDVVTQHSSAPPSRSISAISGINIEDFEEEPLAEAYLDANRRAVGDGVVVRRLFLLDQTQAKDRRLKNLVKKHNAALTGSGVARRQGSGAKWMLKSHAPYTDQNEDFALFANEALVTQAPGNRFELTQDLGKVRRAAEVFSRLWNNEHARDVADLR